MFLGLTVVYVCIVVRGRVLTEAIEGPVGEIYSVAVVVTEGDTWVWCVVNVSVVRDTWDANVLALAVNMLMKKSAEGLNVGLILCEPELEYGLRIWMKFFGVCDNFITFDRTASTGKIVSIGIFCGR